MKIKDSTIAMLFLILISLATIDFGVSGCASLDKAAYRQEITLVTNYVAGETVTNVLQIAPAVTNENGEITPAILETQVMVLEKPVVTAKTNLIPREDVKSAIAITGAAPIPWASTIAAILGAAYGGYATWRNRANQNKAGQIIGTLIDHVQDARKIIRTVPNGEQMDDGFVDTIVKIQKAVGVQSDIASVVEKRTEPF